MTLATYKKQAIKMNVTVKFKLNVPKKRIPAKYITERGTVKKEYLKILKAEYSTRVGSKIAELLWSKKILKGRGRKKDYITKASFNLTISK